MAKGKGGPTFFEVLRTTNNSSKPAVGRALENSRPEEPVVKAPPIPAEPQPLDLVKELAIKPVPVAPPTPVVPEPVKAPPAPIVARHVEEEFEPDQGGVRVTHTVAAFAVLVAVIGMMGAFWFGVRQGRSIAAPSRPAPVADSPAVESPAPVVAQQWYTIKLYGWGYVNEREKNAAKKIAEEHLQNLIKKGFQALMVSTSKEIVLVYGKFKNRTESKNVLDALRRVEYNGRLYYEKADFVQAE